MHASGVEGAGFSGAVGVTPAQCLVYSKSELYFLENLCIFGVFPPGAVSLGPVGCAGAGSARPASLLDVAGGPPRSHREA